VSLGAGESEAISLAIEMKARLLLLDDLAARRLALGLHLPIIGTLGLLLAAKRKGLLETVKPSLDQLMACEFRVSADLYERLLRDAGEAPA
jgi:predicted nucleic acid-binding protein